MEILMRLLPFLTVLVLPVLAAEQPYHVIAYHDVRDTVAGDYDPDQFAVSTANLIDQFTWLRDNGFHVVSLDQIIASREGRQALPDKAVLLTFDDGLASVYSRVYPLLELFGYPAVVSVVTSWIESDAVVDYAEKKRGKDDFLSWDQLREMQASGLVEIASHTHNMHRGIQANPQGNLQPAAKTRAFDGSKYENEIEFRDRISRDLAKSVAIIEDELGRRPRAIAWPYGAYNNVSESVAAANGLDVSITLDKKSTSDERTLRLGRYLVTANPGLGDFSSALLLDERHPIIRVAQIDLDYLFDPDPAQQRRNLDRMLDRIKSLQISHVFLQAFSDDDGDGGASSAYFPNRHLPVRADLFDYVAWQLKTRAEVQVFAWLPMLNFAGEPFDPDWRVLEKKDGTIKPDLNSEPRLSPFHPHAREIIAEVYEDLASSSHFEGVLFHDDGRLSDFEDYSPAARERYRAEFGREMTSEDLLSNDDIRRRWSEIKTDVMIEFTADVLDRVRRYHPTAKSARNIFAGALFDARGRDYLAQDFDAFLVAYDLVALIAKPKLEGTTDRDQFFRNLVSEVSEREGGLDRTIFELQSVDWLTSQPTPDAEIRSTMRWLQSLGVRNLGYYPANFLHGRLNLDELRLGMSLADDLVGAHQ